MNKEMDVNFGQDEENKKEQGEMEGNRGLEVCISSEDGNEDFGYGNGKSVPGEGKMKRKRGRPKKGEERGNRKIVMKNKTGRKKSGKPRMNNKQEVNIEIENNGEKGVNNELIDGELVGLGEEEVLNLECDKEREQKEQGKENIGRNDEADRGISNSCEKILEPRKSRIAARLKMEQSQVEEEFEDEMRITKRRRRWGGCVKEVGLETSGGESGDSKVNNNESDIKNTKKQGRKPRKGYEICEKEVNGREAGFKECVDESEVSMVEGDGGKKQGRKPLKGLEKQEENEGVAGTEEEQEGVYKKRIENKRLIGNEVKADEEGETQHRQNRSNRTLRDRAVKKEQAPQQKKLADENVRFWVSLKPE